MTDRPMPGDVDRLLARADALAAAWAASAAGSTSAGIERAILRLFGIDGLDAAGRPLAAEVVDRHLAPDPGRLAAGLALPLAIGMAEYDLDPQATALNAAAGAIDLALEAQLLAEPDRRSIAEENATRLAAAALARIDANRLARRDVLDVLGDAPRPWAGTTLREPAVVDALEELAEAVRAGLDLARVAVPAVRELTTALGRAGRAAPTWSPAATSRAGLSAHDAAGAPVPTGSQRALAVLRAAADELAAERGRYVRLATEAAPLGAPEQAVVAAFERVDVVVADPMREIVDGGIDPDRALVDHAFAHRLIARAGTVLLVGSGPLVVGRDLAAGVASDPATRAGRALALQLLAVRLAVHDGLAPRRVLVDALPPWLLDEPEAPACAAAEIALRRALLPEHPLAFIEPAPSGDRPAHWAAMLAALLPDAGEVALVLRRPGPPAAELAAGTRAAAAVARGLARVTSAPLGEPSARHARETFAAAEATIEALARDGWRSVLDDGFGGPLGDDPDWFGRSGVAERTESFDPFAAADRSAAAG